MEDFFVCIGKALDYSYKYLYEKELNLFYSTTSVHESAMEEGYTCWVNFSFLYAYSLAYEVATKKDKNNIIKPEYLSFRNQFLYSVSELFMSGDRYIRRTDPDGNMDMRPDFTLLSPFYYGFLHYKRQMEQEKGELKFKGKNFVFDDRLGERITDDILSNCHQCGQPLDLCIPIERRHRRKRRFGYVRLMGAGCMQTRQYPFPCR